MCTSVMSSPVAVILTSAVSESAMPPGPNDCARSVYSPGAMPLMLNVPSGRMPPPADMLKPNPPVDITMIEPVIGRPSDVVAVPLTRVARIGFSAMTMSLICWPTASVIRCACAGLSVPGKYIGA